MVFIGVATYPVVIVPNAGKCLHGVSPDCLKAHALARGVKVGLEGHNLGWLFENGIGVQFLTIFIAGDADAMVADMPACKLAILRNPNSGLAVLEPPLSVEPVGIAVASNDAQFENLVRNYLTTFEKIGLTTQLRQKWFENSAWIVALP